MESFIIETLSCPLDFNLSKSVQQPLKQDSSHTYTSDYSESTDEEAENNDLIDQFKQLSFAEAPDSKYITPKPTNKTSEVNSQEEDGSGEAILVKNKEIEEIQSSSSSLKAEESLKFVAEDAVESTFRNCPNKNCEIYSKKSDTEKENFVGNLESVENQLSSLSLKNNKILNKCYKNNYAISDDDESDSDEDEQAESVTLRERGGHTKHNRHKNIKQQRSTPFTQNASTSSPHFNSTRLQTFENFIPPVSHTHTRHHRPKNTNHQRPAPFTQNASTSSPHFNPNNFQTFENFSPPVSYDLNTPHYGCDFNGHFTSNYLEAVYPSSTALCSDFPTHEIFGGGVSSTTTDEVVDDGVPYTDPEYAVPSEHRNLNYQFSPEPYDTPFFANPKERNFPVYVEDYVDAENSSDSGLENLTEEYFRNIPRSVTDSTSVDISSQNPLHISNENPEQFSNKYLNIISVSTDSSIPDQNVYPSSSTLHSDFPPSEWETHEIFGGGVSSTTTDEVVDDGVLYTADADAVPFEEYFRNLNDQLPTDPNDTPFFDHSHERSFSSCAEGQLPTDPNDTPFFDHSHERSFSGYAKGYSDTENSLDPSTENLTEEYLQSFLRSVTDSTSDDLYGQNPLHISNENLEQSSNEGPNIISVSSDSSIPDQNGIQSIETINPNNNQEEQARNNIIYNQTNTSSNRTEETQICTSYRTAARDVLFNSSSFCKAKWNSEYEDIRQKIQSGELGTEEKTVIFMLPKRRGTKYRGTNLHYAIREEKIERVCCLVEWHKVCHGGLIDEINLRDNSDKTVLDYSKEKGLNLLTVYLEENHAKTFSNIRN